MNNATNKKKTKRSKDLLKKEFYTRVFHIPQMLITNSLCVYCGDSIDNCRCNDKIVLFQFIDGCSNEEFLEVIDIFEEWCSVTDEEREELVKANLVINNKDIGFQYHTTPLNPNLELRPLEGEEDFEWLKTKPIPQRIGKFISKYLLDAMISTRFQNWNKGNLIQKLVFLIIHMLLPGKNCDISFKETYGPDREIFKLSEDLYLTGYPPSVKVFQETLEILSTDEELAQSIPHFNFLFIFRQPSITFDIKPSVISSLIRIYFPKGSEFLSASFIAFIDKSIGVIIKGLENKNQQEKQNHQQLYKLEDFKYIILYRFSCYLISAGSKCLKDLNTLFNLFDKTERDEFLMKFIENNITQCMDVDGFDDYLKRACLSIICLQDRLEIKQLVNVDRFILKNLLANTDINPIKYQLIDKIQMLTEYTDYLLLLNRGITSKDQLIRDSTHYSLLKLVQLDITPKEIKSDFEMIRYNIALNDRKSMIINMMSNPINNRFYVKVFLDLLNIPENEYSGKKPYYTIISQRFKEILEILTYDDTDELLLLEKQINIIVPMIKKDMQEHPSMKLNFREYAFLLFKFKGIIQSIQLASKMEILKIVVRIEKHKSIPLLTFKNIYDTVIETKDSNPEYHPALFETFVYKYLIEVSNEESPKDIVHLLKCIKGADHKLILQFLSITKLKEELFKSYDLLSEENKRISEVLFKYNLLQEFYVTFPNYNINRDLDPKQVKLEDLYQDVDIFHDSHDFDNFERYIAAYQHIIEKSVSFKAFYKSLHKIENHFSPTNFTMALSTELLEDKNDFGFGDLDNHFPILSLPVIIVEKILHNFYQDATIHYLYKLGLALVCKMFFSICAEIQTNHINVNFLCQNYIEISDIEMIDITSDKSLYKNYPSHFKYNLFQFLTQEKVDTLLHDTFQSLSVGFEKSCKLTRVIPKRNTNLRYIDLVVEKDISVNSVIDLFRLSPHLNRIYIDSSKNLESLGDIISEVFYLQLPELQRFDIYLNKSIIDEVNQEDFIQIDLTEIKREVTKRIRSELPVTSTMEIRYPDVNIVSVPDFFKLKGFNLLNIYFRDTNDIKKITDFYHDIFSIQSKLMLTFDNIVKAIDLLELFNQHQYPIKTLTIRVNTIPMRDSFVKEEKIQYIFDLLNRNGHIEKFTMYTSIFLTTTKFSMFCDYSERKTNTNELSKWNRINTGNFKSHDQSNVYFER